MESSSDSDFSDTSESLSDTSQLEDEDEDDEKYADSSKRLETFHSSNDGIDRISELPDLVLRHILSFLDMKEVIGNTSRISRRWRNLWISLPFLNFDHSMWHTKHRFITFIDKVLLRRDDSTIKKLCFCISCAYCEADRVDDWMILAARKHVEEVHLDIDMKISKVLPDLIFNSDVQVFKLRTSWFKTKMQLPKTVCLAPKLKILEIDGVELPNGLLNEELVLSCLSLEILRIHYCNHKHIRSLHICAPQLKKLVLENRSIGSNGFCKLQISTSNLKSLVLKGSLYEDYSLENLTSLECAKFESSALVDAGIVIKVLEGLHNATALELLGNLKMTFVGCLDILDQRIHPFVNLRFLKIDGWSCSSCIPTIHNLLTSSDCLKTLTLGINQVREAENWRELFQCIYCLKSIEIKGLKCCDDELTFFEFVLKNAVVLEYLTLDFHDCLLLTRKEELAEFNMKIHSLPRASSNVKILPLILT
ncbi:F-box/FBD/LRR-repeat protein [Thalictrum thalictroides]|uniref:F-box/FBD/LRR-repeat protein n=1 Tax=Thalictrum thalictroides TaxID=46969 RepID=A0A7J6USJ6_THATH|nr:F-box/FBD/LRR-repeat protein [Thalictrum thalictroides]